MTAAPETPAAALLLPVVHCYCFANAESVKHKAELRQSVVSRLAARMKCEEAVVESNIINMHNVRDVSPNKWMMCATFRVPPEVGFATTDVFQQQQGGDQVARADAGDDDDTHTDTAPPAKRRKVAA